MIIAFGGAALLVLLCCVGTWLALQREAREDVQRWQKYFPGRCLVCAYHRHGRSMGYVDFDEPVEPHHCIEDRR